MLASLPVHTNDSHKSMLVEVTFTETDGMKTWKYLVAVRATVASDVIETSQGRISPRFCVERVRDQRMASVLEHIKIKYSRQENIRARCQN